MSAVTKLEDSWGPTALLNPEAGSSTAAIRVLALAEEETVTGPAKNMFELHRVWQKGGTAPRAELAMALFQRPQQAVAGHPNRFMARAAELGIPVHILAEGFRFDLRVVRQLRELVERVNPDVVETHHVKSHLVVRLSGVWKTRPWIAFHHGYTDTDFRSPVYNRVDRWSLPAAARIVTMNQVFQQELLARGTPRDRMTVLHNAVPARPGYRAGADAETLARKKADLGISPDQKIILCVGRLSREKAQIDLVAVLQHLRRMRPSRSVRVILVGDGPERARISQAIQSAGLSDSLSFAGQVENVAPYYEAADVVAIPSLSEGSPNVLLEAMAFAIPVVATRVGGIPEIVTHGETALLVPSRSPQAMAEAIDLLFSNPGTAMSLAEQARKRVERDYSPQARADFLVEMYNQVHRSARKPSPGDAIAS